MGLPSWLGKGFMPQVYLVPLGQQFQWLTVLWCLSVPHRLRGAEMDPLPAQPSLPHEAHCLPLTITPKPCSPGSANPAENRSCHIPPTAAPRGFSPVPSTEFPFQAARSPQLCCPPGQGSPQALQGCSGALSEQDPIPGTLTWPTISISQQLLGKRRQQRREDPGGTRRWRALIEL